MHNRREVFNEGNSGVDSRAFTVDEADLLKELHLPNIGPIPSPADARQREYSALPLQHFQARTVVRHEEAPVDMDTTEDPGPAIEAPAVPDTMAEHDCLYWSDVVMRDAGPIEMCPMPGCGCRIQRVNLTATNARVCYSCGRSIVWHNGASATNPLPGMYGCPEHSDVRV